MEGKHSMDGYLELLTVSHHSAPSADGKPSAAHS
jgi:hypothetical protein